MTHDTIRESDQYYCRKCGKRWDVNDSDPPECLSRKQNGLAHVQRLREKYFNQSGRK